MDSHNKIMGQVKQQISQTQAKMGIYVEQPPPLSYYPPPNYSQYIYPCTPVPTSRLQMPTYPYIYSEPHSPHSQPHYYPPQQQIVSSKVQRDPLPPLNASCLLSPDTSSLDIRMVQGQIIKRQCEMDSMRKKKEGLERLLENSSTIQGQIDNYPYGSVHSNIMGRIIQQQSLTDYNNQKVLLKFQMEAQEYKKSKSKHIRQLHNDINTPQVEEDVEVRQDRKEHNRKVVSFDDKRRDSVKSRQGFLPKLNNIREDHNVSYRYDKDDEEEQEKGSGVSIRKGAQRYLKPFTDQGEDGLKLIRKNLHMKSLSKQRQPIWKNETQPTDYSNSKSVDEITLTIQNISDIIKESRSFMSRDSLQKRETRGQEQLKEQPHQELKRNQSCEREWKSQKATHKLSKFKSEVQHGTNLRREHDQLLQLSEMIH